MALNRAAFANHLGDLLPMLGINCVLDVGAHRGEHGMFLRGLGYEGLIVSFEPVAESFAELERAMSAQPPWIGYRMAISDAEGEAEMTVYESTDFSSLVNANDYGRNEFPAVLGEGRAERVITRRLDDLLGTVTEGLEHPVLMLKIDAQGAEGLVLAGAVGSLPKVEAIQVEAPVRPLYEGARRYDEVLSDLEREGFELTGLFPVVRDERLRIIELDCVMSRTPA